MHVLEEFYKDLYTKPNIPGGSHLGDRFLSWIPMPSISPDKLTDLNTPITLDKLLTTITHLPTNKATGPDGLTGDFYKMIR